MANILRVLPILIATVLVCCSHSAPIEDIRAPPSSPGLEWRNRQNDITGELQVSDSNEDSSMVQGSDPEDALAVEMMDLLPSSEGLDSLGMVKRAIGGRQKLLKQLKGERTSPNERNPLMESQDEETRNTEVTGMLHDTLETIVEKRGVKSNGRRGKKRTKGNKKRRGKKTKGKKMSLDSSKGYVDIDGIETAEELPDTMAESNRGNADGFVAVGRKFGKKKHENKGRKGKLERKAKKSRKKLMRKLESLAMEEPAVDEYDNEETSRNEMETTASLLRELHDKDLDDVDSELSVIAGGGSRKKRKKGRKGKKAKKNKPKDTGALEDSLVEELESKLEEGNGDQGAVDLNSQLHTLKAMEGVVLEELSSINGKSDYEAGAGVEETAERVEAVKEAVRSEMAEIEENGVHLSDVLELAGRLSDIHHLENSLLLIKKEAEVEEQASVSLEDLVQRFVDQLSELLPNQFGKRSKRGISDTPTEVVDMIRSILVKPSDHQHSISGAQDVTPKVMDNLQTEQDFLHTLQTEMDGLAALFDQGKLDSDLTSLEQPGQPQPGLGGTDMMGLLLETVSESNELERNKRGAGKKTSRTRGKSQEKKSKRKKTKARNKIAKSKGNSEEAELEQLKDILERKKGRKTSKERDNKSYLNGKSSRSKGGVHNSRTAVAKAKEAIGVEVEMPVGVEIEKSKRKKNRKGKLRKGGRGKKKQQQEIEESFLEDDLEPESPISVPEYDFKDEPEPDSLTSVSGIERKKNRKGKLRKGGRGKKKQQQEIEESFLEDDLEPESLTSVSGIENKRKKNRKGKLRKGGRGKKKQQEEIEASFLEDDLEPESLTSVLGIENKRKKNRKGKLRKGGRGKKKQQEEIEESFLEDDLELESLTSVSGIENKRKKNRKGKLRKGGRGKKKQQEEIEESFLEDDLELESLTSVSGIENSKRKKNRKGKLRKGGRGKKKQQHEIEESFLEDDLDLEPESLTSVLGIENSKRKKNHKGKLRNGGRGKKKQQQEIEESFLEDDLELESSMSVPEYDFMDEPNPEDEPESQMPVVEYNPDEPESSISVPEYDLELESPIPVPEYNSDEYLMPVLEYNDPESPVSVPEYSSEDEPESATPVPEYDFEDEPKSVLEYSDPESPILVPEYSSEDEPEAPMPIPGHHKPEPEMDLSPPQGSEPDPCMRCEQQVGEEVCGANGKSYNSLCHAVNCAGLHEEDITAGPCMEKDPCANHGCPANELCVPMNYGPCLALYTKDGHRLPCRQYMCVMKMMCNDNDNAEVCGEDSRTYRSLCHLDLAHVKLAYTGPCRPQCRGTVCGSNGRSFPSPCHAHAHNVRIDYFGPCFAEDLQEDIRDCEEVREAGRCPKLSCKAVVMPKGSCCPVCGGAVTVHPDVEALAELARHWEETNHLYIAENYLRKLVPVNAEKECALSASLTDKGEIELVLAAVNPKHADLCLAASKELAEVVNNPPRAMANDIMKPVAAKAEPEKAVAAPVAKMIFNPLGSIQNSVTKMNEKASKAAADQYNDALLSVSKKADEAERSRSGATLATPYTLVTLAISIAAALIIAA